MSSTPRRALLDRRAKQAKPLTALLVSLALTGCGTAGLESPGAVALVRFVEVSPGSPEMDFYVNGTGAAYGLGYESFTSYLPVSPGVTAVRISRAGRNTTLASTEVPLQGGRQYTLLVHKGLADLHQLTLSDQVAPAAAGRVDLRIVNAVSGPAGITFHLQAERSVGELTETTLFLKPESASAYLHLASGVTYRLAATPSGPGLSTAWSTLTIREEAGAVRTAVFGGTAEPDARPHVVSFLLADVDPT